MNGLTVLVLCALLLLLLRRRFVAEQRALTVTAP